MGGRCRLVLAIETGGRFSQALGDFLRQMAQAKSSSVPWYLRSSTAAAYERRWTRMLAVCAATSHLQSVLLTKEELANLSAPMGREPWLQDLLAESRHDAGHSGHPPACGDDLLAVHKRPPSVPRGAPPFETKVNQRVFVLRALWQGTGLCRLW